MTNGWDQGEQVAAWRGALGRVGRRLIQGVQGLLASHVESCMICGGRAGDAGGSLPVCMGCYADIPWIAPRDVQCAICGRCEYCPDCSRRTDASFVMNRSAIRYTHTMKEWLGRFKYRGDERLHVLMAGMVRGTLDRLLVDQGLGKRRQSVYLSYVPLSETRLAERGFNQTELVARELSRLTGIQALPTLDRVRHTDKQSHKSRAERLRDLRGAFAAREELSGQMGESASIIMIDDVYTTGSTLEECARTLRQAADVRVYGLTWAR